MMKTDPIRIHVDDTATPVAARTAATVPIHWRDEISDMLAQDVALGVIEKVEIGTPMTWCTRMHVVAKWDGRPRRTVDLRPLNTACKRENQHVIPPFKSAPLIEANTYKTKTDAWNGYHSCPLHEDDRHMTTFITEEGRFRYRVVPQGFVASGDGYNTRYDDVLAKMPRKAKCVDDLALWDKDLTTHWWRIALRK
jgi:hypothetical protein